MFDFFSVDTQNKKYLIPLTFLFIGVNLFWGFYSNITWDDDCPTRYFNMLDAINNPEQFVTIWNRPLFMLIFTLPAQLGHWTVIVIQTFLSVIAGWALVKAGGKLKLRYAFLAFPFLVFQPFVFGVSRYAMTEPVAITLICLSLYFLLEKRWTALAIAGGLLPLARLELAILLPFWLIPLLQNKQYKSLIPLAIPMISWALIGGWINNDFQWIIKQTFGRESQENRYGHQEITTYVKRYQYVVGPVLFFFSVIGLPKIFKNKFHLSYLLAPFVIGLITYSIFSSWLNMGNSAGFLRNLLPLSPYITLMALIGVNYWLNISRKNIALPESGKNRFSKKWSPVITESIKTLTKSKLTIIGLGVVAFIVTATFFSFQLESHHRISNTKHNHFLLVAQGILFVLLILRFKIQKHTPFFLLGIIVMLSSYTLITEHPLANSSSERILINKVAKFYKTAELHRKVTYANHPWFFWATGGTPSDDLVKRVNQENLNKAQVGEIAIIENHYSNRLGGNIDMNFFTTHTEWVELSSFNNPENDFFISFYQKSNNPAHQLQIIDDYISASKKQDGSALLLKGLYYLNKEKNMEMAVSTIKEAAQIEPTLFKIPLTLGKISLRKNDLVNALKHFNAVLKIDPENTEANERIGSINFNLGELEKASKHFAFIEKKMQPTKITPIPSKIFITSKRNLAICEFRQKKYNLAFKRFNEIIQWDKDKAEDHYNIAMIYLVANKKESACKALDQAYKMGMLSAKAELDKYCK